MSVSKIAPFGSDVFAQKGKGFGIEAFSSMVDGDIAADKVKDRNVFSNLVKDIGKYEGGALQSLLSDSPEGVMLNVNNLQMNARLLSKISGSLVNTINDLVKTQI